jgi:hypothetical protein
MNESIPEDKFDELISDILAVRAAHQVQAALITAAIAAVEEIAPDAIARVEAAERDKDLDELHERSVAPRDLTR